MGERKGKGDKGREDNCLARCAVSAYVCATEEFPILLQTSTRTGLCVCARVCVPRCGLSNPPSSSSFPFPLPNTHHPSTPSNPCSSRQQAAIRAARSAGADELKWPKDMHDFVHPLGGFQFLHRTIPNPSTTMALLRCTVVSPLASPDRQSIDQLLQHKP